jgi:nitroreductase
MNRRLFLVRLAVLVAGASALMKSVSSWAKGLPSDQRTATTGTVAPQPGALPSFDKDNAFPLEKALLERRSVRSYDGVRRLSQMEVSRLLWAATGVNRPDGRRTVPSALARYPVDVIAALPEGAFQYEPGTHSLKRLLSEDIRGQIPNQDGFKRAGMIVLYVINKDKVPNGMIEWADLEIGCMGQSLFLEATALGLGSCIFAFLAREDVSKALGLTTKQLLRVAQAVGGVK